MMLSRQRLGRMKRRGSDNVVRDGGGHDRLVDHVLQASPKDRPWWTESKFGTCWPAERREPSPTSTSASPSSIDMEWIGKSKAPDVGSAAIWQIY